MCVLSGLVGGKPVRDHAVVVVVVVVAAAPPAGRLGGNDNNDNKEVEVSLLRVPQTLTCASLVQSQHSTDWRVRVRKLAVSSQHGDP